MHLAGRARDLLTPAGGGEARTCAEDAFEAVLKPDRTIVSIAASPARAPLDALVGQRGGGHLRRVLDEQFPEERDAGTPLNLLLDDISGASLIAAWAWSQWGQEWMEEMRRYKADPNFAKAFNRVNICTGLAEGSSGLGLIAEGAPTADLRRIDDPAGWHTFPEDEGPGMRRARRIDVEVRDDLILIDAAFQDTAEQPDGRRMALHEYSIAATTDWSFKLLTLVAEPRVLPFAECPAAADNVTRLLGAPLPSLRKLVPVELRRTAGCTHLNDALRALSDVPVLASRLSDATAESATD